MWYWFKFEYEFPQSMTGCSQNNSFLHWNGFVLIPVTDRRWSELQSCNQPLCRLCELCSYENRAVNDDTTACRTLKNLSKMFCLVIYLSFSFFHFSNIHIQTFKLMTYFWSKCEIILNRWLLLFYVCHSVFLRVTVELSTDTIDVILV